MENQKIGLTIYLLKPDKVAAFEGELKKPGTDVRALSAPFDGEFISLPSAVGEPSWVGVVRSALQNSAGLTLDAQSPAGLLIVRRGNNTFVVTFGHAWQRLEDEWLEREFGLRVALNSIPPNKVIDIRAEQVFANWHIASERAPRASFVDEFGVRFDRDLVASLEGIPSHPLFGKHIRGGTSLRLELPFPTLLDVLDKATTLFKSTAYKTRWPEVGNVSPVNDLTVIATLEEKLDAEFASGEAKKKLVLFTPARRHDEPSQLAHSYVFGRLSKNSPRRPYLLAESWSNFLKEKGLLPSIEQAKFTRIHLLNEAKEEIKDYTVFDCLCYELALKGQLYILSSGVWYEVVSDFLASINQYVARIQKPSVELPAWEQVESESEYIIRCAKTPAFLHFDSANVIFGGGSSRFEFCDFLHQRTKTLFFAKIASKSSGMSHLVEQVRRTAELLFSTDGTYRQSLAKVFSTYHPKVDASWLDSRPRNGDWNLCMVSLGRPANKLPFFAKCALWRVHKDLTERGHKVSFGEV